MNRADESGLIDRAKGCLLGGAIGDALGAPVEFIRSAAGLEATYGPDGIQEFDEAYGRIGAITDDTQMTLFSAEGIIRANVRGTHKGICHLPSVMGYAYQRWLYTQGEPCHPFAIEPESLGWLATHRELFSCRAPGGTCLSALRVAARTQELVADNNSKGCGTVMRSAPFGFAPEPWQMAMECSAITHGHPEAGISSAVFATMISFLVQGSRLREAVLNAMNESRIECRTYELLLLAVQFVEEEVDPREAISRLGEGWVAEEALAIGVYCALKYEDDFEAAVRLAVNHVGDSDSTGSICGNLLGARHGLAVLPERWLAQLELRSVIEQVAVDLVSEVPTAPWYDATEEQQRLEQAFWDRYPGC
jgi:ADP-ribosylglycohydrolase